jgi:hypothetical protein
VRHGSIKNRVHSTDVHCGKANGTGGKPWLLKIVIVPTKEPFGFNILSREVHDMAAQSAHAEGKSEDDMKILYVEDNGDNVNMLKNRLNQAVFTVVIATDAAQGIAMAASETPDLILMDITLPRYQWRGSYASAQSQSDHQAHSGHRAHGECDGRRSGKGGSQV